jgi:hypothetical protein
VSPKQSGTGLAQRYRSSRTPPPARRAAETEERRAVRAAAAATDAAPQKANVPQTAHHKWPASASRGLPRTCRSPPPATIFRCQPRRARRPHRHPHSHGRPGCPERLARGLVHRAARHLHRQGPKSAPDQSSAPKPVGETRCSAWSAWTWPRPGRRHDTDSVTLAAKTTEGHRTAVRFHNRTAASWSPIRLTPATSSPNRAPACASCPEPGPDPVLTVDPRPKMARNAAR